MSLSITVVAPSVFVLCPSPVCPAAAVPGLKFCLAWLGPGGLVALAMTAAFSGTLVALSGPLKLMSIILGRSCIWAKAWSGFN